MSSYFINSLHDFSCRKRCFRGTVVGISCETQQAQIKTQEWKFVCGSALSPFSAAPPSDSHITLRFTESLQTTFPQIYHFWPQLISLVAQQLSWLETFHLFLKGIVFQVVNVQHYQMMPVALKRQQNSILTQKKDQSRSNISHLTDTSDSLFAGFPFVLFFQNMYKNLSVN